VNSITSITHPLTLPHPPSLPPTRAHTHTYTHTNPPTRIHTHTYTPTNPHTHTHARAHTYTYTHTYLTQVDERVEEHDIPVLESLENITLSYVFYSFSFFMFYLRLSELTASVNKRQSNLLARESLWCE